MAYSSLSHSHFAVKMSLPLYGLYQLKIAPGAVQTRIRASLNNSGRVTDGATEAKKNTGEEEKKRCLRCGSLYLDMDNSPTACSFHGHFTGERGLFSLAPPHQGIDGEWSDTSGVIVYRWNEKGSRPNTGSANWKKRWSCCQEYNQNAPPCRRGWHVSYDDGFILF